MEVVRNSKVHLCDFVFGKWESYSIRDPKPLTPKDVGPFAVE
jgi:hypothetical protein